MSGSTLIQEQDIDPGVGFAKESTAQAILEAAAAAKTAAEAANTAAATAATAAQNAAASTGGIRGKCKTVGVYASEGLYSGSDMTKTFVNITGKGRINIYNNDTPPKAGTLTATIDGVAKDVRSTSIGNTNIVFEFNKSFKLAAKIPATNSYSSPSCTWQLFE